MDRKYNHLKKGHFLFLCCMFFYFSLYLSISLYPNLTFCPAHKMVFSVEFDFNLTCIIQVCKVLSFLFSAFLLYYRQHSTTMCVCVCVCVSCGKRMRDSSFFTLIQEPWCTVLAQRTRFIPLWCNHYTWNGISLIPWRTQTHKCIPQCFEFTCRKQ